MTKLLIRLFIKNSDDIDNPNVRNKYGSFSGMVGILLNILLFVGKFIAGVITSSIAITADAFNNLSDAGSSIISLVGFKMAGKPADNEHPFGHGRFEYISGFVISMIIILMGLEIGKTSIGKIIKPEDVSFSTFSIAILLISVLIKLWLCFFNRKLGKMINSQTLIATSKDSLSDVLSTTAVIIGVLISKCTGLNIDGFLGVAVAVFILYTGFSAAKGMLDQLLGEAPDKEFIEEIKNFVMSYDEISGVHDVIIHNYGANRCVISLHAEVPCDMDIMVIHDIIDVIEVEMSKKFNCSAVIHMDPIAVNDEYTNMTANKINNIIRSIDERISMHDFRMVTGNTHTNLIFDVVVPFKFRLTDDELKEKISQDIKQIDDKFNAVINIDKESI